MSFVQPVAIDVLENDPLLARMRRQDARQWSRRIVCSFSSFAASSSWMFSLKRSSTIATGAVPQLARHSTNSIEYLPSGETAIGLPCPALWTSVSLEFGGARPECSGSPWARP